MRALYQNYTEWLAAQRTSPYDDPFIPNPVRLIQESGDAEQIARLERVHPDIMQMATVWDISPHFIRYMVETPALIDRHKHAVDLMENNPAGRQYLEAMRDLARSWGGELRVVVAPQGWSVNKDIWPTLEQIGFDLSEDLLTDDGYERALEAICTHPRSTLPRPKARPHRSRQRHLLHARLPLDRQMNRSSRQSRRRLASRRSPLQIVRFS